MGLITMEPRVSVSGGFVGLQKQPLLSWGVGGIGGKPVISGASPGSLPAGHWAHAEALGPQRWGELEDRNY